LIKNSYFKPKHDIFINFISNNKYPININHLGFDFYDVISCSGIKFMNKICGKSSSRLSLYVYVRETALMMLQPIIESQLFWKNRVNKKANTDVLCGICTIVGYARVYFTRFFLYNNFIKFVFPLFGYNWNVILFRIHMFRFN